MIYNAQRGEDRKLDELTGHKDRGFYIDIGAWHPEIDSYTKVFYDRGWRGVNVEPNPAYFRLIEKARPDDVNLQVAISDESGHTFTIVEDSGLSTFHPEYAKKWSYVAKTSALHDVKTMTLLELCDAHVPAGVEIDWLKIDVEGWERHVILSGDWIRYRPRFVVIEATEPGTDIPAWEPWEYLMLFARYKFFDYDGLNRWYRRT